MLLLSNILIVSGRTLRKINKRKIQIISALTLSLTLCVGIYVNTTPLPDEYSAADLNGDGQVTTADLLLFLPMWGTSNPAGDFDGNGTVGALDKIFIENAIAAQSLTQEDESSNTPSTDINGDGIVNVLDLQEFSQMYGSSNPAGDFDGNGTVGMSDQMILLAEINSSGQNESSNTPSTDINGDGIVNVLDLQELSQMYGSSNPAGDFDGNGIVGMSDQLILLAALNSSGQNESSNTPSTDINGDGLVDALDLQEFSQMYGSSNPAGDFDGNGTVGMSDQLILLSAINSSSNASASAANDGPNYDLNSDGVLTIDDLNVFLSLYGTSNSQADFDNNGTVGAMDLIAIQQEIFGTSSSSNSNGSSATTNNNGSSKDTKPDRAPAVSGKKVSPRVLISKRSRLAPKRRSKKRSKVLSRLNDKKRVSKKLIMKKKKRSQLK